MVVFRLKSRFLVCNRVIFAVCCFLLLSIINMILQGKKSHSCVLQEPIDVVYTWVNGSDITFLNNLKTYSANKNESCDISKQRYNDKHELKFSLRSLETYAPWVNHVYIVTNGQIPSWLNLDFEKVTIVTHDEIFKDDFNLPTFSSPAIEANLHRIPGLSKKFIYFNDDMFLGQPSYPEDYYSASKGFLVYLARPVPNCSPSCSWLHVADGQCDQECFVSQCQMDGGDCDESNKNKSTVLHKAQSENETRALVLADTIKKLRSNFYKSFTAKSSLTLPTQHFDIPNTVSGNISEFVHKHNKLVMRNERLRRKSRRKRQWRHPIHNIDAYSYSLQHTNRMLNKKFGFKLRQVPAHAPVLIDKDVMEDLQNVFPREFEITERNRVRRMDDVQFSFSYYSFLMEEMVNRTVEDIFQEFDTDSSGTWSDREMRTLLSKLYELPLSYDMVEHFEMLLLNCSENEAFSDISTPPYERYVNSRLSTISKEFVIRCHSLSEILLSYFGAKHKYRYELVENSETKYLAFKMLHSDINHVAACLDDIRKTRRKFICLNDNLDESKLDENELVVSLLLDFYISLFPHRSKFELPADVRNKFFCVRDLNEWKVYRYKIKMFICSMITLIPCVIFYSFCKRRLCQATNKLFC